MTAVQPSVEATIRAAIDRWELQAEDVVLFNGSRVEGFGNVRSDVDLYVITPPGVRRAVPVHVDLDGFKLNVSMYSQDVMDRLAAQINAIDINDHVAVVALPRNNIDRYYRVPSSIVMHNAAGAARLRQHFSLDHAVGLYQRWSGLQAVRALDEAHTAAGSPVTATLHARRAFAFALDSFLAAHGEAFPSPKWRFEKLARCVGPADPLFRRAWALKSPGWPPPEAYVAQCAALCDELGAGGLPLPPVRYTAKPSARLFQILGEAFLVRHKTFLYRLTPEAEAVWSLVAEERTRDEVVAGVTQQTGLPPAAAAEATDAALHSFVLHGLLDRR